MISREVVHPKLQRTSPEIHGIQERVLLIVTAVRTPNSAITEQSLPKHPSIITQYRFVKADSLQQCTS
jgi:hypothetical protein